MIKKRALMALSVAVATMASTAPAALAADSSFNANKANPKGKFEATTNAAPQANLPFFISGGK